MILSPLHQGAKSGLINGGPTGLPTDLDYIFYLFFDVVYSTFLYSQLKQNSFTACVLE
jgi:hypothetical protein